MPFYQKGDVRIRYEETGSGFPLLIVPGGGLNSRISNWSTAVINAMEAFKNDFLGSCCSGRPIASSPLSFAKPSAIGRKTRQSCIDTARITGNPTS